MRVRIICVGKLNKAMFGKAAEEYLRRLAFYGPVEMIEVPDAAAEREDAASATRAKEKEGTKVLSLIPSRSHVVALCIDGQEMDSQALSRKIDGWKMRGVQEACFVVGGSYGLSAAVLERADETLSFSKMTFAHQLFRVMLLEQLYRAMTISAGHTYHK